MSGFVLAVGALLAVAGVYEMIVGNGDILSERGWSAFIAGSVFVAGGVSTVALGIAVRSVDRLRAALPPSSTTAATAPRPVPTGVEEVPATAFHAPVALAEVPHAEASRSEAFNAREAVAPLAAAATVPDVAPSAAEARSHTETRAHPEPLGQTAVQQPAPEEAALGRSLEGYENADVLGEDWLEQSFADLERDAAHHPEERQPAPPPPIVMPSGSAEPELHDLREASRLEIGKAPLYDSRNDASAVRPETLLAHDHRAETANFETSAAAASRHETAQRDRDRVEPEPEPVASEPSAMLEGSTAAEPQVIGRYESEGTSYVMYADGSIDAQSEAGVYRFASMAELKSFIES